MGTRAWPAFEMCLAGLPLVDDADRGRAGLSERLLLSLASEKDGPLLWQLVEKAASPTRRALNWRSYVIRMQSTLEVIARDESQGLIETVIRAALTDPVSDVRECAQNCLRWMIPVIASETAAAYILTRLEQQIRGFGLADGYLLELLWKCLYGLALSDQPLPAEIVSRALNSCGPCWLRHDPRTQISFRC